MNLACLVVFLSLAIRLARAGLDLNQQCNCEDVDRSLKTEKIQNELSKLKKDLPFAAQIYSTQATISGPVNEVCSGILLSRKWALTSESCIRKLKSPFNSLRISFNENISPDSKILISPAIKEVTINPKFDYSKSPANNIALIELQTEIELGARMFAPCIFPADKTMLKNAKFVVAGYGSDENGTSLKWIKMERNEMDCEKDRTSADVENSICISISSKKGLCTGHEGSPVLLIQPLDSNPSVHKLVLVGVIRSINFDNDENGIAQRCQSDADDSFYKMSYVELIDKNFQWINTISKDQMCEPDFRVGPPDSIGLNSSSTAPDFFSDSEKIPILYFLLFVLVAIVLLILVYLCYKMRKSRTKTSGLSSDQKNATKFARDYAERDQDSVPVKNKYLLKMLAQKVIKKSPRGARSTKMISGRKPEIAQAPASKASMISVFDTPSAVEGSRIGPKGNYSRAADRKLPDSRSPDDSDFKGRRRGWGY